MIYRVFFLHKNVYTGTLLTDEIQENVNKVDKIISSLEAVNDLVHPVSRYYEQCLGEIHGSMQNTKRYAIDNDNIKTKTDDNHGNKAYDQMLNHFNQSFITCYNYFTESDGKRKYRGIMLAKYSPIFRIDTVAVDFENIAKTFENRKIPELIIIPQNKPASKENGKTPEQLYCIYK